MSRNLIVVILLSFIGSHGGVSRAKPVTPDGTWGGGVVTPTADVRALPEGRTEPDTSWFGGFDMMGGDAILDGTWDFSDGTLQGWTSVDLTENTGVYFGRVTASSFQAGGDPATPMFPGEVGQLWCGMHQQEADTRDWEGGMGYGNGWWQSAFSPYLTCTGQHNITVNWKMFNDSESAYDYTYLYVLAYDNAATPNLLEEIEIASYDGVWGTYEIPVSQTKTMLAAELPTSTAKIKIEFRFVSDKGWSDEDGLYLTSCGPFAADQINITVAGGGSGSYDFESGAEGWTFAKRAGKGRYISVTGESVYQPWLTAAGIDSCVLVGDVMDFVRDDGMHPEGQYELAISPPCASPDYEPGMTFQVLLKAGVFYTGVTETQTYFRFGYRYYPYTTEVNPNPHWSPRVGSEFFEGPETTACETLSRALSELVPEDWDELQMCVEVYCPDPGDALGAPLFDDLRIGIVATPLPVLQADFTAEPTGGFTPLTVQFTDLSVGSPSAWEWDLDGNGTLDATVRNPLWTYPQAGEFDVTLVAMRGAERDTLTRTDYITVETLSAGFVGMPTSGLAPLTVQFSDSSLGSPTAWEWDLDGNGTVDATVPNPTFQYITPGTYDVSLTVARDGHESTLAKAEYITAEVLEAGFTGEPRFGPAPLVVNFTDQSTGHPTAWAWDLDGDGTVESAVQNPIFQYETAGSYDVTLVVTREARADTVQQVGYIDVLPDTLVVEADGSGDFPTIQAAVDAAFAGMVIELGDGVFTGSGNREVSVNTAITIQSHSGNPTNCILDCQEAGRAFLFRDVGAPGAVLSGVTITHSFVDGGGVICIASAVAITECRFVDNYASVMGGGLYVELCPDITVRDCLFLSNVCDMAGGGFACVGSSLDIENTTFADNRIGEPRSSIGGAGYVTYCGGTPGSVTLTASTLCGNSDGLYFEDLCDLSLDRTIITFCTVGAAVGGSGTNIDATCCDTWGNAGGPGHLGPLIGQDGNIAADPLFCDVLNGDFSLRDDSPCLPDLNPVCGQVGAWPVGCAAQLAAFVATPALGRAPLSVQFSDQTEGDPDGWEWDFEDDGQVDATIQNPLHEYPDPGTYSVRLTTYVGGVLQASLGRTNCIHALAGENVIVHSGTITSHAASPVPIQWVGTTSLGAVSIFIEFDPTKVSYAGLHSFVPGETFVGGVVGDRVSIQWFDETGGLDPLVPGVDPDTLFAVLFEAEGIQDTTQLHFDQAESMLGDRYGDPLPDVHWIDDPPLGTITISMGAVVSGRVGYYWMDRAVPRAELSMGMPNADVISDEQGEYLFPSHPFGNYVLQIEKGDDLGGINSLDAIKIVRHATGLEPLGDPHKLRAADVNLDGHINSLDALKVVLAALGLQPLPAGDWAFDPDSVSLAPLDSDRQVDFVAMRMGDVNGDWTTDRSGTAVLAERLVPTAPEAKDASSLRQPAGNVQARLSGITLALPDTLLDVQDGAAGLPLRVTDFNSIGAVSLRITFANDVLQYMSLESNVPGVSFSTNLVGSEIRIEWYDATGGSNPITMGSGTLLTVHFLPIGADGQSSPLVFGGQCALGDPEGDPLTDVEYIDGMCSLLDSDAVDEGDDAAPRTLILQSGRPNPFRPETVLTYSLPQNTHVDLAILDVKGRWVATLMDSDQGAGVHRVTWDGCDDRGSQVSSGVYFARLRVGGESRVLKLVRCR